MSGAAGHLQHLYENRNLTFREIKEILRLAASGKLEHVSEKLDGMNLVFTWNEQEGLRVARSIGDIRRGGMDVDDLALKFAGRGNIHDAFVQGFSVLDDVLSAFELDELEATFGTKHRQKWYSVEIVYSNNPGTINYDSNNVVIHNWPIFEERGDKLVQITDDGSLASFVKALDSMQHAISVKNWRVRGPAIVRLQKLTDGSILRDAYDELDRILESANLNDESTILDYLRVVVSDSVMELGVPYNVMSMVVDRVIQVPNAPTLHNIKKVVSPYIYERIAEFVKKSRDVQKKAIRPVEMVIHKFAVEVLRGLKSTLVNQHDSEIKRLRNSIKDAIKRIENSNNPSAISVLHAEMSKLGNIENIDTTVEGVVFIYKGKAYKFTGSFAPVHQILSLFRYGNALDESTQ